MAAPIVFFDIAGPDAGRLKAFYMKVFDWRIDAASTFTLSATVGLRGAIREDPAEKILYLGVDDIDFTLIQVEANGGETVVPRTVVPGVVTFALFTDPAGNRMGLAEIGSFGA